MTLVCSLKMSIPMLAEKKNIVKSSPVAGLEWLRRFQEVKVPRFHDNGTGWWYGLSTLRTGRLYPRKYT